MKKIISIFLCLFIAMSCVTVAAAADDGFEISTNGVEMRLLQDLGIISGDSVHPSDITRGEFADLVCRMMNIKSSGGYAAFSDVPNTHPYTAGIDAVNKAKIMNGGYGGTFRPDDKLTLAEAVSVMVKLLGYAERAEARGGYPMGYITEATLAEIIGGNVPELNAPISRSYLYKMVYNTLLSDIAVQDSYGDNPTYSFNSGKLFINEYHRVYVYEGVITANGMLDIDGKGLCADGRIRIDGKEFLLKTEISSNVGYRIIAYYRENGNRYEIISYAEGENVGIVLNAQNIVSFSSMTYTYSQNTKDLKLKVSDNARFVYNGVELKSAVLSHAKPATGSVTLIENTGDNQYDIVYIDEFYNIVLEKYSAYTESIYERTDVYNSGNRVIRLESYESYSIIDTNGVKIEPEKLARNSILSVFESTDSKTITIKCSSNSTKGEISEISTDAGTKLIIGGNNYEISSDLKYDITSISLGTAYTYYLDSYGKIAFIERNSDKEKIVYFVKGGSTGTGLSPEYCIQAVTDEGTLNTFKLTDKVKITTYNYGISSSSYKASDALALLGSDRKIILLSLKKADKSEDESVYDIVTDITLPYAAATENDALDAQSVGYPLIKNDFLFNEWHIFHGNAPSTEVTSSWIRETKSFSMRMLFTTDGLCFSVPATSGTVDEKSVGVMSIDQIPDKTSLTARPSITGQQGEFEAYSNGSDILHSNIMVWYSSGGASNIPSDSRVYIISDIKRVLNAETGDTELKLSLMNASGTVEYTLDDESKLGRDYLLSQQMICDASNTDNPIIADSKQELEVGDLIKADVNTQTMQIKDLMMVYDYTNKHAVYNLATWNGFVSHIFKAKVDRIVPGGICKYSIYNTVQDPNTKVITESIPGENTPETSDDTMTENDNFSLRTVIVYDGTGRKPVIRYGSVADIEDGDIFVGDARYQSVNAIFLYKE